MSTSSVRMDGGPALIAEDLLITCVKCGKDFVGKTWNLKSRDYRCPPCKREQQNSLNRSKPSDSSKHKRTYQQRKEWYRNYHQKKKLDAVYVFKKKARKKLQSAIESGKIIKPEFCDTCHKRGKIQAHHPNYKEPLNVEWKCTTCHGKSHNGIRSNA